MRTKAGAELHHTAQSITWEAVHVGQARGSIPVYLAPQWREQKLDMILSCSIMSRLDMILLEPEWRDIIDSGSSSIMI